MSIKVHALNLNHAISVLNDSPFFHRGFIFVNIQFSIAH